LVEIDIGMKRCGVRSSEAAAELARQVVDAPGLQFAGLMGYEGHLVMLPDPDERAAKVQEAMIPLRETCARLDQAGIPVPIVSGGGTGTYSITGTSAPMTEIQAGSYILMDKTYLKIRPEFRPAITVLSTVISRPTPECIVTDAGIKTMSKEFGWPQPLGNEDIAVQSLSEEHARLVTDRPERVTLHPGDKVHFIPSHCCTTVNLHDNFHVVQNGKLVDIWPVAARGRAQ
jgi:D-serine deaminase-like pyridoxal phosphate-dependent protein